MLSRAVFASFVPGVLLATAATESQTDCRAGGFGACDAYVDSTRPQSTKTHAHNVLLQKMKTISSLYRKEQDSSVTSDYDITTETGLKYADDNDLQVLDIYTPDVDSPPSSGWLTVIAIHGVGGSEKTFKITCQYIAQGGRQCMSIDYKKLSGYDDNQAGFDACSSKAIDWARRSDIASTYNIDTSRIILLGQSRGGFVTADLAFSEEYDQTRIAGAIIMNGLKKDQYNYLAARTTADVPLLVMSTQDDNTVQDKWSLSVVELMESMGGDVTHINYVAGGHNLKKSVASLYEHINDWLLKFDPSPPIVGSTDMWLEVCKEGCECFDAGEPVTVADLSACEAEADKHGHRYIMFYDQQCATTLTCDYSNHKTKGSHPTSGTPWMVYWRLHSSSQTEEEEEEEEENPTPPPTIFVGDNCNNWCYTNTENTEEELCTWKSCKACSFCEEEEEKNPTPSPTIFVGDNCKDWCYTSTENTEEELCTWKSCKACSFC